MGWRVQWNGLSPSTGLVVLLVLLLCRIANCCEYAHISPRHTMCIYQPRVCEGRKLIRSGGLNCMEKQVILEEHNRLRQGLANGKVKGQPGALNMREMVWDEELARVSQRWADQCMPGHDQRRNVDRYAVGQNVATTWTFNRVPPTKDRPQWRRHIMAWFDEVFRFGWKSRDTDPFMFRMNLGHFTQLAWADTYMVGCGYSYYDDPKRGLSKLYVCNYGPGGNLVGDSMYKVGFPGLMSCVDFDMAQSSRYVGLCEVKNTAFVSHMCQDVAAPSLEEMPPDMHRPTPRPSKSIFHEMMGDNTLSNLAMHSTHLLMKGVKDTMDFTKDFFNPFQWAVDTVAKPFMDLMDH